MKLIGSLKSLITEAASIDDIKKSNDTKLKQEIRKAKTLIEVVSYLQKVMK